MSKDKLNKKDKSSCEEDISHKENNLEDILKESLLLNIDIFSSEFEDEIGGDEIQEDKVKETQIKEDNAKENNTKESERENNAEKGSNELKDEDLKIDFEEKDFSLNIEEDIQETDIGRSKKEFNAYMRKLPKERRKPKIKEDIVLEKRYDPKNSIKNKLSIDKTKNKKHVFARDSSQGKGKRDKFKEEYIPVKTREPSKSKMIYDFDFIREPINKKVRKTKKEKNSMFNIDEMDSKRVNHKKTPWKGFSIEIPEDEIDNFSMDINGDKNVRTIERYKNKSMEKTFDKGDKMSVKKENNLKVEVL